MAGKYNRYTSLLLTQPGLSVGDRLPTHTRVSRRDWFSSAGSCLHLPRSALTLGKLHRVLLNGLREADAARRS